MHLSEVWAESHWADAHIQLPEWSDYRADFALLNGRVYPDTLAPNAPYSDGWTPGSAVDQAVHAGRRPTPTASLSTPGYEHLQYQPSSSLVDCMAGERVALRFSNLGFKEAAMTIDGIPMHVVGRDATLMAGRDGTDTSYLTNTINFNAGESFDVIITAPAFSGGSGSSGSGYDVYMLYNRNFQRSNNLARWRLRRTGHRDPGPPGQRQHPAPDRAEHLSLGCERKRYHDASNRTPAAPAGHSAPRWPRGHRDRRGHDRPEPALRQPALDNGADVGIVCSDGPTFDMTTDTDYINLPDGNTVYMYGYKLVGTPFQHPSPVLCVNEGDTVTITLDQHLAARHLDDVPRSDTTCWPTARRRHRSSRRRATRRR